jgi:hypothetical protein
MKGLAVGARRREEARSAPTPSSLQIEAARGAAPGESRGRSRRRDLQERETEGGAAGLQERDGWNEMKREKGFDSPRNARARGVSAFCSAR